jgi:hypothetical protein
VGLLVMCVLMSQLLALSMHLREGGAVLVDGYCCRLIIIITALTAEVWDFSTMEPVMLMLTPSVD